MNIADPLHGSTITNNNPRHASSIEDFWMFFAFAMILVVFVLMNYVSYLYSMVVKAPDDLSMIPQEAVAEAVAASGSDIRVYVKPAADGVRYTFADDESTPLDIAALRVGLAERIGGVAAQHPVRVHVHAPGNVYYQDVFNASYSAWEIANGDSDGKGAHPNLDVHLVFEGLSTTTE